MKRLILTDVPSTELLTVEEMKSLYGGVTTSVRIYNCVCSEHHEGKDNASINGVKAMSETAAVNSLKKTDVKNTKEWNAPVWQPFLEPVASL